MRNNLLGLMINLVVVCLFMVLMCGAVGAACSPACYLDSDCKDSNPYIIESCEDAGECNATCVYRIPYELNYTEKKVDRSFEEAEVSEKVSKITNEENLTTIFGAIEIDSRIKDRYFFYVIQDPHKYLTSRIDHVAFSVEPFRIKDDAILFLLSKDKDVHLITYSIDAPATKELLETTDFEQKGVNTEATIEELNVKDKVEVFFKPGDFDIMKAVQGILFVILIGFLLIGGYIYWRKKGDDYSVKLIKE